MKRKIYLTILLIFFFFVFDRGAAFLFREIHFSFYSSTNLKRNIFGKMRVIKKGFYDTMIFGTSRAMDSIHPMYLFNSRGLKAFKEAKPSRYPRYYYHFYKRIKSMYGKPKFLIYGVDYFIFNLKTSDLHLFSVMKNKKKVRKLNFSKISNNRSQILSRSSILFRIKKKLDRTISDFLYKLSLSWDSTENRTNALGIDKFVGRKRTLKAEFRIKPKKWEKFEYKDSSHGEGKFLKLLFDELEKDGVKVFLIGIPDYIGTYRSNFQQDKYVDDVNSLISERKNFRFLNYNHPDKFDLSNPEYFTNGGYGVFNSHMSYFGGIQFNKIFSEDLRKILKISQD